MTLTELAAVTGISGSTLSPPESGQRRPSLELLLPIVQAHRMPLDELVGTPQMGELSGALRLIVADYDIVLQAGEVAEFDTRVLHWFGAANEEPVEILSLLSRDGERIHVRARPTRRAVGS